MAFDDENQPTLPPVDDDINLGMTWRSAWVGISAVGAFTGGEEAAFDASLHPAWRVVLGVVAVLLAYSGYPTARGMAEERDTVRDLQLPMPTSEVSDDYDELGGR